LSTKPIPLVLRPKMFRHKSQFMAYKPLCCQGNSITGNAHTISTSSQSKEHYINPPSHPSIALPKYFNESKRSCLLARFRLGFQSCDMTHHQSWHISLFAPPVSIQYRLHVACQSSIWKIAGKTKENNRNRNTNNNSSVTL